MKLDKWQEDILSTRGNIALRSGRQVGKSTIISIKAAEYAINHPKATILVISAVERQAYLLFEKIIAYLADNHRQSIKKGKDRPTKHKLTLKNGAKIYSLPTGMSGYGIRGYTVDLLIADEAAFINEDVWQAVIPMLAMTGGNLWLLSTPFGRKGFYYQCFSDKAFTKFHVQTPSVLDMPNRTESQKADLKKHLDNKKRIMSKVQWAQEYLGEFVDELRQYFPTELIERCMTLDRHSLQYCKERRDNFLGVDVARMGDDETVLLSLARYNRERLSMIDMEITTKTLLTQTAKSIKFKDAHYRYKQIYIDTTGQGFGVFDILLEDSQTKRKVVSIENAFKSLDTEGRRKRLLKEDLYANLLKMMEAGQIDLFDDPEVMLSLKSVQYEYKERAIRIFGAYTHIAEALIRAAWCMKDKTLKLWLHSC